MIGGIAALIIVVPILMQIATGVFAIDPFHFGLVVCINLVLGLPTPPVGAGLHMVADMSGARPTAIFLALLLSCSGPSRHSCCSAGNRCRSPA